MYTIMGTTPTTTDTITATPTTTITSIITTTTADIITAITNAKLLPEQTGHLEVHSTHFLFTMNPDLNQIVIVVATISIQYIS
jgi:hypothetical protein